MEIPLLVFLILSPIFQFMFTRSIMQKNLEDFNDSLSTIEEETLPPYCNYEIRCFHSNDVYEQILSLLDETEEAYYIRTTEGHIRIYEKWLYQITKKEQ